MISIFNCKKSRLKSVKRILLGVLSLSVAVLLFIGITFIRKTDTTEHYTLHNPDVDMNAMCAGQKVTWDCVWFGSYPQTEVKSTDSEYETLQSAEGWNESGDIEINGAKYRRMLKDDATYHYFKNEPVKWRVLKTDGNKALLLSDIVLDNREYNTEDEDTTWETSTIRSWLNGYGADKNREGISYAGSNFIDSAFTAEEQSAIEDTDVVNNDNIKFDTEGGNGTIDKMFLLSEAEVYTYAASAYGFIKSSSTYDEGRRCKSSDYAKAMGVYTYNDNCYWWLRSPGYDSRSAACVDPDGYVNDYGDNVSNRYISVRVALNLNLTSYNLYKYAGMVSSDGTVDESVKQEGNISNPGTVKVTDAQYGQNVKWDCVWFGSYPQTEVKSTDSEYEALQSTEGWNENGDIVINDTKYRRMLKGDATYSGNYDWEDDTTYHYFKYEPVKWRVLKTDGRKATLLSDVVLDDRKYNTGYEDTTWETSAIRSWLNGYGADMNHESISNADSNFIDSTFTAEEQSAIADTDVVNDDNIEYGTEGGNNTVDKLFLLSESEAYTKEAKSSGFSPDCFVSDVSRECRGSDYAKAMGVYTDNNNCYWWLRSPGGDSGGEAFVYHEGNVDSNGYNVDYDSFGVRVALNLNLTSSNLYTYAGTVCSDGTVGTTWESSTEEPK